MEDGGDGEDGEAKKLTTCLFYPHIRIPKLSRRDTFHTLSFINFSSLTEQDWGAPANPWGSNMVWLSYGLKNNLLFSSTLAKKKLPQKLSKT